MGVHITHYYTDARPLLEAQYVIIMKKKILLSSILVFFSLTCIVVFSTIAIKEKARKEAMENTFFRNLKIIWNDETGSSKGKIIEIPFHIYVSSMGDEEFYNTQT